jgi:hypothetical protein
MTKCLRLRTDTQGRFAPGHDQKLRANLEKRVGGLLALERLVQVAALRGREPE